MTVTVPDTSSSQSCLGAFADGGTVRAVLPVSPWSCDLTSAQARELAAALVTAAAAADQWASRR